MMFVVTLSTDKEIVVETPAGPVVIRVNTKRRRVAIDAPQDCYIHLRPIQDQTTGLEQGPGSQEPLG